MANSKTAIANGATAEEKQGIANDWNENNSLLTLNGNRGKCLTQPVSKTCVGPMTLFGHFFQGPEMRAPIYTYGKCQM